MSCTYFFHHRNLLYYKLGLFRYLLYILDHHDLLLRILIGFLIDSHLHNLLNKLSIQVSNHSIHNQLKWKRFLLKYLLSAFNSQKSWYYNIFQTKARNITWTLYSRTILSLSCFSCTSSSTLFSLSYFWSFSWFTSLLTLSFTRLCTSCPIIPITPFAINYISNRKLLRKIVFNFCDFSQKIIKYFVWLSYMILHLPSQISLHSLFPLSDSSAHPSLTSLQYLQTPLLVWLKSHHPLSPLTLGLPSQTEEFVHWTKNSWMVNCKSCLRIVSYISKYFIDYILS